MKKKDFTSLSLDTYDVFYSFPNGNIGLQGIDISESEGNLIGILGDSGTGKTTLCKYIIDIINERTDLNYILLSPTGRAARVLARKTNSITSTVHQHIYKRSNLVEYIETNKKSPPTNEVGRQIF